MRAPAPRRGSLAAGLRQAVCASIYRSRLPHRHAKQNRPDRAIGRCPEDRLMGLSTMNKLFEQIAPPDEELTMGRHSVDHHGAGSTRRTIEHSRQYHLAVLANVLKFLDLVALLAAGCAGYVLRYGSQQAPSPETYLLIYLSTFVTMVSLHIAEGYRIRSVRPLDAMTATLTTGGCASLLLILICAYSSGVLHTGSPVWIAASASAAAGLLFMNRVVVAHVMQRGYRPGKLTESIVIVGANDHARKMMDALDATPNANIRVLGVFDDRMHREMPDALRASLLGSTNTLLDYIRRTRVDRVVVTMPWVQSDRIDALLKKLRTVPVRIDLVPSDAVWKFPAANMEHLGSVPILTVANERVDAQSGIVKRIEDVLISGFLLPLLSPVLLGIALAIKLDSNGPVIFRQRRHGFNNEVFEVYKFRSMTMTDSCAGDVVQATRHDRRVTRVGAFLRRTSLDELPQLFNVLLGTMSIVGPRPHAVQHNLEFGSMISEYFARHNVKPGITGWAQVNGFRGETDTLDKMHRRVEYDLHYIEHWSLWLDLKIILRTAIVVWFDDNAY
jgi:Undecaprenyl-phosphate glucose phosphotransferase